MLAGIINFIWVLGMWILYTTVVLLLVYAPVIEVATIGALLTIALSDLYLGRLK